MKSYFLALICLLAFGNGVNGQEYLYCIDNPYRSWWNVVHYTLKTTIPAQTESINGTVTIRAVAREHTIDTIQIDLQSPLQLSMVKVNGIYRAALKNGNAYLIPTGYIMKDDTFSVELQYQGVPVRAKKAPWDGGFVRDKDENGKSWLGVACQGIGASVWFPCKDYPGDEPELGADLYYTTDAEYTAIGNGALMGASNIGTKDKEWHWRVTKPINLYDITFYIGDYMQIRDTFQGSNGVLPLDYYILRSNVAKAQKQFAVVKPMLRSFEYWMGPYPFYTDGYKLVDAPYLGMEHQSAIAYGNEYKMGYAGTDRSQTGVGTLFDFIIVHESGHEWFGNQVSINDVAYSWIHEGFTTYSETLFAESLFGQDKAFQYQRGCWRLIRNDRPMEGIPGNCDGGSGDHYVKGSAMIHMIRMLMKDDQQFRQLLLDIGRTYGYKTISGPELERFMIKKTKLKLKPLFAQYLRTTQVPELVLMRNAKGFTYQWQSCIDGYNIPVLVYIDGKPQWLKPTTKAKQFKSATAKVVKPSPDFYINCKGLE